MMGPNILIPQHFISVREQPVQFIAARPEVHSMVRCQDLMFFAELSAGSFADKRQVLLNSRGRAGNGPNLPRTGENKWRPEKKLIKQTDGARNAVTTKHTFVRMYEPE